MIEQDQRVIKSMIIVTLAIALIGVAAFFIAQYVADTSTTARQPGTEDTRAAVQERIQPVGKVAVAGVIAKPVTAKEARSGKEIITASCGGCHHSGVAGAPKIGSKRDWEDRVSAGMDALLASVVKGKGIMPPRAGGDFSDVEIVSAIKVMMTNSGL